MKQRLFVPIGAIAFSLISACGSPSDEPVVDETPVLTKDEARASAGKGDHIDWCAIFDWYGDGICDDFCSQPDPDCAELCETDADCDNGYCEHYATCAAIGCPPPPPSQCVIADCDDGSSLHPLCDVVPVCGDDEVAAVINGCFSCVDARSCEPADATGQMCGGIAGLLCPDGYTCEMPEGSCGWADAAGTCVAQSEFCPAVYEPVCGCDGNTYSNDCHARGAGVTVDHRGECAPQETVCGARAGNTCADDEYCAFTEAAMCGWADATGVCEKRPEACIQVYEPVCGCDGRTYSNGCMAANSGMGVLHDGACN